MAPLSLHVVLLVIRWLPVACYSYQSKSLFMTFSELAALEKKSQDRVWVKCLQDSMEVTVVEVELPALDESVSNEQKGTKDLKAEESLEC